MSRLIDADALMEKYGDWYTEEGTEEGYIGTIKGIVNRMPTIDPERKTGKWIRHEPFDGEHKNCNKCIECSNCGTWFGADCYAETSYCPSCGADMREGQDEVD